MSDLRMELMQGQLNDIEENVRSIKATWGNTIMTLDNIKSSLKADRQRAIEESYQKGLEDAWECARKIYEDMSIDTVTQVYGHTFSEILSEVTVHEALAKLREYEQKQEEDVEIKVGDEVTDGACVGVVTKLAVMGDDDLMYVVFRDGSTNEYPKSEFKKTGRHFPEVAAMLEKMKGE